MSLDDVLAHLLPDGVRISHGPHGTASGTGRCGSREVGIVAIENDVPLGIRDAILLASHVLEIAAADDARPILFLVATSSQEMARSDELLGLNEFLSHLAKSLGVAAARGHRTVGILHGAAAAGAFIATALATEALVALPGAEPSVMDLPSMARVTKLPLETLEEMSKTTPIFAPGLDPLAATGAVADIWEDPAAWPQRLAHLLDHMPDGDRRDLAGRDRGGRLQAADIAARVHREALGG